MLDPTLALALSIHSGKGVYALLLGSGISRTASIPTGWEIVLDLIRKLAHAKGEDCEPDPEAWYRKAIGGEPDYSDILDQITKSSTERMQLLRGYFEPTEEDREENRKAPTDAHRAIARLVAKGYIRVILTTNFDRLLEIALTEEGVQPTVISTTEAIQGAIPLVHSPCTIVKIHGDYRDTRIRNTKQELASYDPAMDAYLDRIFDEYGLVVCGWSAEWDIALRAAIERCSTRRFGTYWSKFGELAPASQKLFDFRAATQIPITGADAFFKELSDKVQAIEDLSIHDPLEPKVAVARLKRYLRSTDHLIELHDLLHSETERVQKAINAPSFSALDPHVNEESIAPRLSAYEAELQRLLPMLACLAYWASHEHFPVLLKCVTRIANSEADQSGVSVWSMMQRFPASLLYYAVGIAALSRGQFGLLSRLLRHHAREAKGGNEKLITELLSPWVIMRAVPKALQRGVGESHTPFNERMFHFLREPLREFLPADHDYETAFDSFEYIAGLAHCLHTVSPEELDALRKNSPQIYLRGPLGRFLWRINFSGGDIHSRFTRKDGHPMPQVLSGLLESSLFPDLQTYIAVKLGFDRYCNEVRARSPLL